MEKPAPKKLKLIIPAGQANPAPPIGPALGQRGLNIMDFCKQFNEQCKKNNIEMGLPTPVIITFMDKKFTIQLKTAPVPVLIKKAIGMTSASKKPGTDIVGSITMAQIKTIALAKLEDMGVDDVEAAIKMVVGTCRSMGIKVA